MKLHFRGNHCIDYKKGKARRVVGGGKCHGRRSKEGRQKFNNTHFKTDTFLTKQIIPYFTRLKIYEINIKSLF